MEFWFPIYKLGEVEFILVNAYLTCSSEKDAIKVGKLLFNISKIMECSYTNKAFSCTQEGYEELSKQLYYLKDITGVPVPIFIVKGIEIINTYSNNKMFSSYNKTVYGA